MLFFMIKVRWKIKYKTEIGKNKDNYAKSGLVEALGLFRNV